MIFKKMILFILRNILGFITLKIQRPYYKFIVRLQAQQVGRVLKVQGMSRVTNQTILGTNVSFNGMQIVGGGKVEIGDNFHSGPECLMITQFHNYDSGKRIPYDGYILKDIVIEDNVWLGSRVIILGGVIIGEGAIIQAGSVVISNIPKYAIAGGHPAKIFNYRDIKHYEQLKKEEKFH